MATNATPVEAAEPSTSNVIPLPEIEDPRDEAVAAFREKIDRALIEYASRDECEIVFTRETGWYVIDRNTYDGEALQVAETPTGALLNWFDRELELAGEVAA